jgi:hypothetical protein
MSQENKRAKLGRVQEEIRGILVRLEQIENDHSELYEAEETLAIELSELQQKESKLLAKIKPV